MMWSWILVAGLAGAMAGAVTGELTYTEAETTNLDGDLDRSAYAFPLNSLPSEQHDEGLNDDFYRRDQDAALPQFLHAQQGYLGDVDPESEAKRQPWAPTVDNDRTLYLRADNPSSSPFISLQALENEVFADQAQREAEVEYKRNFSPWREKQHLANERERYGWTWKRAIKASNMPKRVRFSPWGGKRSGNVIFKPNKKSGIIYTSITPESRVGSDLEMNENFPLKTSHKSQLTKFKRGVNVYDSKPPIIFEIESDFHRPDARGKYKNDEKRKVKFSAWGGKRSPPILGTIWAQPSVSIKENMNKGILFDEGLAN